MNAQSTPDPNANDPSAAANPPEGTGKSPAADNGSQAARPGSDPTALDPAAADQAVGETDANAPQSRDEAMERMAVEVEQARQRVLMAQAELENFRKRTRKDYEDQIRFAAMPLVEDLLQVRDNLVRAIDAAENASSASEGLKDGVQLVVKQLDDVFGKHGIQAIAAVGEPFDPNVHEAIAQTPSDTYPEGVVAIEATTGFLMHHRVVRPSQVVVSTGTPQA